MKLINQDLTQVARGLLPADLILENARIVNVFSAEIETGNVAIHNGYIAGIGDYQNARRTIDLQYRFLLPGLINGHVHIESSLLNIGQYARAVVAHGTTGLVTDLHEITNVCGVEGINYVLHNAAKLPLDLFLMAPSCVPATHLETSGAEIGVKEIKQILKLPQCRGLGEMMNYPGVLFGDRLVYGKIATVNGQTVDGHAPGLHGKDLNAYIAAGIRSDHESVSLTEAREKLRRGMYVMIREGSSEKNLEELLPLVDDHTYNRCLLVVDDRSCYDLYHDGDMDAVVRKAIGLGLHPVRAIQMATINPAIYFGIQQIGAVAPGYRANLIVTGDLHTLPIDQVFYRGKIAARNTRSLFKIPETGEKTLLNTIKIKPLTKKVLELKTRGSTFPVVEVVAGQIITRKKIMKVTNLNGKVVADIKNDILKLVVVERHKLTGNVGVGLVHGFGLESGAIASSVAHDSHNIVVVGVSDEDILTAVNEIEKMQGGLVVVDRHQVVACLPLPVAGLLSDKPLPEVVKALARLENTVKKLGAKISAPFAALSFLALPVIPELRVTDLGIVDVNEFRLI